MDKNQERAIAKLKSALKECGKAGLKGGVYDGSFCIWPKGLGVGFGGNGSNFFEEVIEHGEILHVPEIHLDGGAGV